MALLQVKEFLSLLKQSALLTAAQWDTAQNAAKQLQKNSIANPDAGTVESLAAELAALGLLTHWQASQLTKRQTGFVLGKYRLLTPVGRGGMGHVFKARDDKTRAIVAIKVMSQKLTGNQTLVSRFRREIRASSQLNNPHIVRTLDAGRVGSVDFMVMEFVNGDQLDRITSRISAIPVGIACEIIRQAAIGLQHAHEQHMVHRDIKPGNLIIDWSSNGRGTVKIMDMGLVRLNDDSEEENSVTRAGQVMGTPDYMSPEQGWNTATVDSRSDLYSLGCTFFRVITGRVPFPGDNPLQVLMARCSKDAPSARTHRPEIPESVDNILRRMTLRDPDARFQTATEVVTALTPFCTDLTQKALQKAAQGAGLTDPGIVLKGSADSEADSMDQGYQQFLKEMDSGAAVDLMLTTNSGQNQALSTTIPGLPQIERPTASVRPDAVRKKHFTVTIALAVGSVVIAFIAVFMLVIREKLSDNPSNADQSRVEQNAVAVVPKAKLKPADPIKIRGGQVARYQPEFDGDIPSSSAEGSLQFRLGKESPEQARIHPETGAVEWSIPENQTPAEYFLPIEYIFSHNGSASIVAQTTYRITVEAGIIRYSLPHSPPLKFLTQQLIEVSMIASPLPAEDSGLTYRLARDQRPGMSVDPVTGRFEWTPSDDDAGQHTVTVELCDAQSSSVLATGSVTLIVSPKSITLSLPSFAEQKAKPGESFELKLSDRPLPYIGSVLQMRIGEGSPSGIVIDSGGAKLRWNVPKDAKGRYEIRLIIEPILPDMQLAAGSKTDTTIVVNVEPDVPATRVPSDAEVAAADKELRELFKREIAQAKSVNDRAALARQFMDRAENQTPGASDFALLNLAAEFAKRGKATDVGLESVQRLADRYQIPELPEAKVLISEFRANSATAGQQDAVVEHGLRLAAVAAASGQFADIGVLLQPASVFLKKTEQGSFARRLADDIRHVLELAEELTGDAGAVTDVKIQEVNRILNRWQFSALFTEKSSFSYLQSGNPSSGLPDSGRSLWMLKNDHIQFEVKPAKGVLGFIETVREPEHFIIRMQISSQTTSAMLILGAGREAQLNSHLITLDAAAFGQITTLPVVKTLVPGTTITAQNTGWNDFEVLVDGQQVSIRLNGQPTSTSLLTGLRTGRLGLLVSLERVSPPPKLDIRHARILLLPE